MDKNNNIKIPKGWKYLPFGEVFEFIQSNALSREQLTFDEHEGEIFNIHYGDIHSTYKTDLLDLDKEKKVPRIKDIVESKTLSFLRDGDLVIADASEDYKGVAANLEIKNIKSKKVTGGLHTFVARDNSGLTVKGFRTYVLKNPAITNDLKKLATGSKVYGISKTNLGKLKILLPTEKEQVKISKILTTWNTIIETLENLIIQKERNKKALMQLLLTGKKRFKEFKGEKWKSISLEKIAQVVMGQSPSSSSYNENGDGLPLIQGNADLKNRKTNPRIYTSEITKECKIGDIILTVRAPVGAVAKSFHNACIGRGVCALTANKIDNELLYYLLLDHEPKWKSLEQGSTFAAVNSADIKGLEFKISNSLKEQKRISSVLAAIDEEIQILENQLDHIQQQKFGLMQVLLTGKKRVKL